MIQSLTSVATRAALDRLGHAPGLEAAQLGISQNITNNDSSTKPVSFDQVLAEVFGAVGNNLEKAETLSLKQISGEDVPIRDVVNSVMEAERSLNMAIAIRDKIVQAYLEVSRMQI